MADEKSSSPGRPVLRERLEVGETGVPAGHSAVVRGPKPDIDFDKVGASSRTLSNNINNCLRSISAPFQFSIALTRFFPPCETQMTNFNARLNWMVQIQSICWLYLRALSTLRWFV